MRHTRKKVEPKCPYCSNTLYIYGRSSLKRNCRFQHYRKDECRTKKSKSANLPDFSFDNSQIIKDLGNIENLKRIFVVSRDILKSSEFSVKDFMELLIYPALKQNVFFLSRFGNLDAPLHSSFYPCKNTNRKQW